MDIRPATIDDARGIAEVHVRAWRAAYPGIVPQDVLDAMSVEDREARWRNGWLSGDEMTMWVAEDSGTIAGWCIVGPSRDVDDDAAPGELYGIYVDPQHWGKGPGQTLFDTGVSHLRSRFDEATLWATERNARARRFYERNGWHFDGTNKSDDSRGFVLNEVRYRTRL
jgi:GNAT superfamily N-acetyltransferase